MSSSLEKEQKIVEEAKKDPERFAVLYDKYFEAIYSYVFRRVNDKSTTEDLVSQTFYDALSHLHSYQFRGFPFSSWLYKIAHNNVLKWYRQNSKATSDLNEAVTVIDKEDLLGGLKDREEQVQISTLLHKLDDDDRELIRLKFFEEVSNIDIAEIMGISPNNVGVKLYRALQKLKQIVDYQ